MTRSASNPRASVASRPPPSDFQELYAWAATDEDNKRSRVPAADASVLPHGPRPLAAAWPAAAQAQGGASAKAAAVAAAGGKAAAPTGAAAPGGSGAKGAAAAPFSAAGRGDLQALAELAEDLESRPHHRRSCPASTAQGQGTGGYPPGGDRGGTGGYPHHASVSGAPSGQPRPWAGVEAWAAVPAEAKRDELLAARAEAARRERERAAARQQAEETRVQEPERFLREVGLELQQRQQRRRASDTTGGSTGGSAELWRAREEAVRRERQRNTIAARGGDNRYEEDEDEVVSNFLRRFH